MSCAVSASRQKAVVGEGLQKRVVVQDQHKIPGAVLEGLGVGVVFQVLDPGVIRGHSGPERRGQALCSGRTRNRRYSPRVPGSPRGPIPAEISGSGFRAFPVQAKLHRVLGKGEIAHLVEGLLGIVVPELMDPDQIKRRQSTPRERNPSGFRYPSARRRRAGRFPWPAGWGNTRGRIHRRCCPY